MSIDRPRTVCRPSRWPALACALAVGLAGCQTTDPITGETKTSNTARGAGIGALAGAAVGALTNTSSGEQAAKNALLGAGIGALAGGGVGAYMDRQERRLREELADTGVGIRRNGNTLELVMPGNLTFSVDSDDISAEFYPVLNDVALVLDEYEKTIIRVEGHTDSTGSTDYNQALSVDRANAVASYLINQDLMAERFVIRGLGESQPVATNDTEAGRLQNRRVELELRPLTQS